MIPGAAPGTVVVAQPQAGSAGASDGGPRKVKGRGAARYGGMQEESENVLRSVALERGSGWVDDDNDRKIRAVPAAFEANSRFGRHWSATEKKSRSRSKKRSKSRRSKSRKKKSRSRSKSR